MIEIVLKNAVKKIYRRAFPEVAELFQDHRDLQKAVTIDQKNYESEKQMLPEAPRSNNPNTPRLFMILKQANDGLISREEAQQEISRIVHV